MNLVNGTAVVSRCCIQDLYKHSPGFNGNIGYDPLFTDPDHRDFTLTMNSPGVNSGDNAAIFGVSDLTNVARVFGSAVDMGAFELQSAPGETLYLFNTPTSQTGCVGTEAYFSLVYASGHPTPTIQWQQYNGTQFIDVMNDTEKSVTIS
jgi:hypothetical protein